MGQKAIIFDLDGTLLDSIADLGNCMNTVLQARGLPIHSIAAYKYFVGDGLEMLIRRALPPLEAANEASVADCRRHMRQEYDQRWAETTAPYPGIPQLLDDLVAGGCPLAILSNKPHDYTRLIVARLLPAWPFACVVGARPGVNHKPDPAAAWEIARELNVPPESILFVGDTAVDMQTATRAGMIAVGAAWGFRSVAELSANGARHIIFRPADLPGIL